MGKGFEKSFSEENIQITYNHAEISASFSLGNAN